MELKNVHPVPVLRGENLVRRYGGRTVVDVDELEVHAGEVLAVLGPNGAGKSTLFRTLMLLEAPDAGCVFVGGSEAGAGDTSIMRTMASVFQRTFLFDGSVYDAIAFGLRARGTARAEIETRVPAAMESLDLTRFANARVRTLSGGEAQRVGLARALVLEPAVLALDEPTMHLDISVRRQFREDIERTARSGTRGTLLITHDPTDAFALADRIAVMERGRIVQVGTPSDLVLNPVSEFVAEFTGCELLLHGKLLRREGDLAEVEVGAVRIWAHAPDARMGPQDRVNVAYRPEDIALAPADAEAETSAVNRFALRVDAVVPAGALVRVRLSGDVPLTALITARSCESMGIAPGRRVTAHLKAAAIRAYPASPAVLPAMRI